jgi:hypothetical protein
VWERIVFTPGAGATHLTEARCAEALPSLTITTLTPSSPGYHEELEAVGRLLEAHRWTFAKTMPDIPHWWSTRRQWPGEDDAFSRCVRFIKLAGVSRRWRRSYNRYLDFGDFYYWVCDPRSAPPSATTLINRGRRVTPALLEVL